MTFDRIPTDPRFSRRRRAVERSRRRKIALRGGTVAVVAAVGWLAFASPLLAVSAIMVRGARHTTPADVERVARLRGENLLLLSTDDLERRLRALPWVKRARVSRRLPGTVAVRVVERRAAMVVAVGNERWTIDAAGVVLQRGSARRRLPVVAGIAARRLRPGARLAGDEARAALRAYRRMPARLRRRVAGVFAPTVERITFSLADRTLVRYGAAEELRAKNSVVMAVLRKLKAEGKTAAYIDVRVPASPAVSATAPPGATAPAAAR